MKNGEQGPDYKKIFEDLIKIKYPEKEKHCKKILKNNTLSALEVLKLNTIIFGYKEENQKFKSYDEIAIKEILDYQKLHRFSNKQLATTFNLSRNTVTKWKKMFPE
ncbi:helix-turn-helix domain-containing protein [Chryseobacterium sp.]|uniref:helix-turn-helix domain-containing protein n=1 Tax=Chryseobacterium sp. TaxID=1871047 RepID=UPI003219AB99